MYGDHDDEDARERDGPVITEIWTNTEDHRATEFIDWPLLLCVIKLLTVGPT